eukprot:CAMPEP_0206151780 /NCGR_PEP_ID=MMETSP1473-20131121/38994_1 /ASSEMBLY_ACC=CAM_ASM_001109 /TAXON_ID=1461547 /ORGANISM="Stichococcus sp, Strain RCC1054" /LENGTH=150 /DNA_ID=CAMNT_0053549327 /DNA_START=148 /DNA_END=602 /DNA_ORIENTATION=+
MPPHRAHACTREGCADRAHLDRIATKTTTDRLQKNVGSFGSHKVRSSLRARAASSAFLDEHQGQAALCAGHSLPHCHACSGAVAAQRPHHVHVAGWDAVQLVRVRGARCHEHAARLQHYLNHFVTGRAISGAVEEFNERRASQGDRDHMV